MTTYGINNPTGTIPFTGFSPTLGVPDAVIPVTSGVVQNNGDTTQDQFINRVLRTGGARVVRRVLYTLLGAAPGAAASETRTRIKAVQGLTDPQNCGGVVPIETASLISRVTSAADLTAVQAIFNRVSAPASYPADLGGNGGGGKGGF